MAGDDRTQVIGKVRQAQVCLSCLSYVVGIAEEPGNICGLLLSLVKV